MRRLPRPAGLPLALAGTVLFGASLLVMRPAAAGAAVARVSIDHVRVTGAGRHDVVVRVQDSRGAPVDRLESKLSLTLDGLGVGELVTEFSGAAGPRRLLVVVDAPLLRGETAAAVDGALRAVATELAPADRIGVVLAGDRPVFRDFSARELTQAGDALGAVAAAGGPRLFDAVQFALVKAAKARRLGATAVLVLTRAIDRGSRATPADLEVAARQDGVTSIAVMLVTEGDATDRAALAGLVSGSGGVLWSMTPRGAVPAELAPGIHALLDRYRMTFKDARWKRDENSHRLAVRAGDGGLQAEAEKSYVAKEVYVSSGGMIVVLVAVVAALLAGAAVFMLSRRRRQQCLLVVQGGPEDGQWYEVFELPLTVGSARENDMVFVRDTISRQHCMLERQGTSIVVTDLKSEHGTWVNDTRVIRHALAEDDILRLGTDIELAFEGR